MNKIISQFYSGTQNNKSKIVILDKLASDSHANSNVSLTNSINYGVRSNKSYNTFNPTVRDHDPYRFVTPKRDKTNFISSINKNLLDLNSSGNSSALKSPSNNPYINDKTKETQPDPALEKSMDFNIKSADSINDSLELLKLELYSSIRKMQNEQSKFKTDEMVQQMMDFKKNFQTDIAKTFKRKEITTKKLITNLNHIKEELIEKLEEENSFTKEDLNKFKENVVEFRNDINGKIKQVEKRQKVQMNQLQSIMINSNDETTRLFAEKFLSENPGDFNNDYIPPSKKDIMYAKEDLEFKLNKSEKRKDEIKGNNDLKRALGRTRTVNAGLNDDLKNKEHFENLDEFRERNLTNVGEKVRYFRTRDSRKTLNTVYDRLNTTDVKDPTEFTLINKFRSCVYAVWFKLRLERLNEEANSQIRLENLNHLVHYYQSVTNQIRDWVHNSTFTAQLAIKNYPQLNLDISTGSKDYVSDQEKYIKIEIRIRGLLDELIENTHSKSFSYATIAFFKLIISKDSVIPFKYLTLFEISRLNASEEGLINKINEEQQIMIVCCIFLVKTLIHQILVDIIAKNKNINVKTNYKIIASVLYHVLIQTLSERCNIVRGYWQRNDMIQMQTSDYKLMEYNNSLNLKTQPSKSNIVDKFYLKALNKYNAKSKIVLGSDEQKIIDDFNIILPDYTPDDSNMEMKWLVRNLYKLEDLQVYFKLAKGNKSDLSSKILEWGYKMINIINK